MPRLAIVRPNHAPVVPQVCTAAIVASINAATGPRVAKRRSYYAMRDKVRMAGALLYDAWPEIVILTGIVVAGWALSVPFGWAGWAVGFVLLCGAVCVWSLY